MEQGLVRGILWRHLAASGRATPTSWPRPGAADLVPAAPFADALAAVARGHGEAELRRLAQDSVASWARTFCSLTRHLRGRPERTLALWAEEVYPFLRGTRLAARVEATGPGQARLALADDLAAPFVCGLVESFLGLSGARASCRPLGSGLFEVRWSLAAGDRLAAWVQQLTLLRLPLLACALAAGSVGVAAGAAMGDASLSSALLVLVGLVAAQSGASGLADLTPGRDLGPLGPVRPARAWSWFQCLGSYGVAAVAGAWFLLHGRPWVAGFAAAGLAAGLLYAALRHRGAGPLIAGLTYGPLTVAGAAYAVAGGAPLEAAVVAVASLPIGLLAAALLHLDDLADRPLDEAGGRRTLVVALPRRRQVVLYGVFLGSALAVLALASAVLVHPLPWQAALLGALPAALLVRRVHLSSDEPHQLAPARAGTLALAAAASLVLVHSLGGVA